MASLPGWFSFEALTCLLWLQADLAAHDPVAFVAGQQRGLLAEDGKPFVYVNVVLSDSQLFVPVLDMVRFRSLHFHNSTTVKLHVQLSPVSAACILCKGCTQRHVQALLHERSTPLSLLHFSRTQSKS